MNAVNNDQVCRLGRSYFECAVLQRRSAGPHGTESTAPQLCAQFTQETADTTSDASFTLHAAPRLFAPLSSKQSGY